MVSVRFITHFIALVVLISTADICLLLSLLIRPISEDLAWRFASYTAEWFWAYMQNHWQGTLNAKSSLVITGDEIPAGESAVVISNHLSYSDYYLVQALASRAGMLGRCRYFVKREIVYQIPLFGWAFWALGMILVSRNWANDEKLIDSAFARIKENEHAAWIILYPEGTRRTDKKLIDSQAFARKNGKNELQHLLFPRTKGFVSTIRGLRESHVKYLYDLTFLYTSPSANVLRVPSMGEQLSEDDISKAGYGFRIHVKRSPIAELPIQEDELKTWCENRWAEKDALLSEMIEQYNPSHATGKAVAEGTKKRR